MLALGNLEKRSDKEGRKKILSSFDEWYDSWSDYLVTGPLGKPAKTAWQSSPLAD